jgi:PIN domain nuclease of toxin-antitoxin system
MKLLLDTHTVLWSIGKSNELSEKAIQEMKNTNNEILVSAVSLWEIALKYNIGKLIMDSLDIKKIPGYCEEMGFELIPLEPVDALNSWSLPHNNIHKDPFDRMLIYQCIKNGYIFVSKDTKIEIYKKDGLKYIW